MSAMPTPASTESRAPHLSRWSFAIALGISLAIFFLLHPLWKPLDMAAMDRNIIWSYAAIPLLALGLLAFERKLRWSTWLLETLRLLCVKFAITFLFANLLWTILPPPGPAASAGAESEGASGPATSGDADAAGTPTGAAPASTPQPASTGRFDVRPAPAATPIDASRTGRLAGVVVDAAGAPRAGALVAVTGGLERLVFAPRPEGVVVTHDELGLQPAAAVLLTYEPLVLRSTTAGLHTIRALDARGRQLFNTPVVEGAERTLMFDRALGRVTLGCTVHDGSEPGAVLAIVDNPFAMWTGDDGRFRLEGVPEGQLELTAWAPTGESVETSLKLDAGQAQDELRLTVP